MVRFFIWKEVVNGAENCFLNLHMHNVAQWATNGPIGCILRRPTEVNIEILISQSRYKIGIIKLELTEQMSVVWTFMSTTYFHSWNLKNVFQNDCQCMETTRYCSVRFLLFLIGSFYVVVSYKSKILLIVFQIVLVFSSSFQQQANLKVNGYNIFVSTKKFYLFQNTKFRRHVFLLS